MKVQLKRATLKNLDEIVAIENIAHSKTYLGFVKANEAFDFV